MRQRIALLALFVAALALTVPSMALAHHARHHSHAAHHARLRAHHHVHHAVHRAGHGSTSGSGTTPSGAAGATGSGVTLPGPASAGSDENAGTISSYENGVLVITLKDGSTLSGKITDQTRICQASAPPTPTDGAGDGGDDSGQVSAMWSQDPGQQDSSWGEDERGEDTSGGAPHCCGSSPPPLSVGATVQAAELRVSGSGAEWELVVLASS